MNIKNTAEILLKFKSLVLGLKFLMFYMYVFCYENRVGLHVSIESEKRMYGLCWHCFAIKYDCMFFNLSIFANSI